MIEERITALLDRSAETAPDAPLDLLDRVHRARRRRLTRQVAGFGGTAVVVVALVLSVVAARAPADLVADPPIGPPPAPVAPQEWPRAEQVWPDAILRIPRTNADGGDYRVEARVDDRKLLLSAPLQSRQFGLYLYDTTTKATTQIGRTGVTGSVVFGAGNIVWAVGSEYWTLPVNGGQPHLVFRNADTNLHITWVWVTGNQLVFAATSLYTVPLSGGEPRRIADSDGWRVVRWPWATNATVQDGPANPELRNLETGKRVPIRLPAGATTDANWCDAEWCFASVGGTNILQKIDGSSRTTVQCTAPTKQYGLGMLVGARPMVDVRVNAYWAPGSDVTAVGWGVCDPRTGKFGTLGDVGELTKAATGTQLPVLSQLPAPVSGTPGWITRIASPNFAKWPDPNDPNTLVVLDYSRIR